MTLSDETIHAIEAFYTALSRIEDDFFALRAALSDANFEQQDLLHELELSPLAADERIIVANKMIEVRKRRRQIDDDMKIIEPMVRFAKGHDTLKIPLKKLARDMRQTKEGLQNRQYTPRIRTDIKLYRGELATAMEGNNNE